MARSETIEVDVSDLLKAADKYQNIDKLFDEELNKAMTRAIFGIQALAVTYAPIDTGYLRNNIGGDIENVGGDIVGTVAASASYARVVEEGRAKGAPMPPSGVLIEWMRRKGIDPSAEFAIRRAISKRGIPARPFLTKAFKELRPKIVKDFQAVPKRVFKRLTTEGSAP